MCHEDTETRRRKVPPETERVATIFVDAVFKVHSRLGPGLLESVYETCLEHELAERGIRVRRQVWFPVIYRGLQIDQGCRVDLLIEDCLIVELKAVEALLPIHQAQLLGYLRHSGYHLGFLVNFNVPLIKHGIKRMIL